MCEHQSHFRICLYHLIISSPQVKSSLSLQSTLDVITDGVVVTQDWGHGQWSRTNTGLRAWPVVTNHSHVLSIRSSKPLVYTHPHWKVLSCISSWQPCQAFSYGVLPFLAVVKVLTLIWSRWLQTENNHVEGYLQTFIMQQRDSMRVTSVLAMTSKCCYLPPPLSTFIM